MIELIKTLFSQYGYEHHALEKGHLYTGPLKREEFWLVMPWDGKSHFLATQDEYFQECARKLNNPALEKNLSLLLVWQTTGHSPIEDIKQNIMRIEEDAYFFKKYVLHYSETQKDALLAQIGEQNISQFILKQVKSQSTFKEYKDEKLGASKVTHTWQSLLYRLAIKIPFIHVDIHAKDDLGSLYRDNEKAVQDSNDAALIELNDRFFNTTLGERILSEDDLIPLLTELAELKNAS